MERAVFPCGGMGHAAALALAIPRGTGHLAHVRRAGQIVEVPADQLAPKARQILAANGEYLLGEKKPNGW
jgi:hypothetical protein